MRSLMRDRTNPLFYQQFPPSIKHFDESYLYGAPA